MSLPQTAILLVVLCAGARSGKVGTSASLPFIQATVLLFCCLILKKESDSQDGDISGAVTA